MTTSSPMLPPFARSEAFPEDLFDLAPAAAPAPRRGWRYYSLTWQDVINTIEIRTMFESEVLRRAGAAEVLISARDEQSWARGENIVRDAVAGVGPLAGAKRQ